MPIQPLSLMPGGIIQNQQVALARLLGNGLSHLVEKELKDIRVDSINDQTEQTSVPRANRSNDTLTNVISQIRHGAWLAGLHPASPRPRITFHTRFIAEPELKARIDRPDFQASLKFGALFLVLPFRPRARHAQMKIEFMEPADRGAITKLQGQLFFEIAVNFNSGPMNLAGLSWILSWMARPLPWLERPD